MIREVAVLHVGMFSALSLPVPDTNYTSSNRPFSGIRLMDTYSGFSYCEDMSYMFYGQVLLEELVLGDGFDSSSCSNMSHMFELAGAACETLDIDFGKGLRTSRVTDMESMFDTFGATGLTSLNLGEYFDTSKCSNFTKMFHSCGTKRLENLLLGPQFKINSNSLIDKIFNDCGSQTLKTLNLSGLTIENAASTSLEFDTIRKY